jgi:hypothetical protein
MGVMGEIIGEHNVVFALPHAQHWQGAPHIAMHLLTEGRGKQFLSLLSDWLACELGLLTGVASE